MRFLILESQEFCAKVDAMGEFFSFALIVVGLCLFEVISSIDNAIINAEVLSTMQPKARKWFLFWGILFAVFFIRGLLPWVIVWFSTPGIGPIDALTATFSSNPLVLRAVEESAPILLAGGGTFLIFLFFHWLFMEPKNYGLIGEKFFHAQGVWFYAVVSVLLCAIVWFSLQVHALMAFGAVVGSTAFFITHGFKENAEKFERELLSKGALSDISKILYLEVIDATFSIDGVLGAFAFTLSVPLILLGNGLGAVVVRQITVGNVHRIKRYLYLKNGAMYSIFFLGVIMLLDAFGVEVPSWVSPVTTFGVVGYFFLKSQKALGSLSEPLTK
ncbi:MAG: DUF475 domain-containing protein [Candidatus Peribacteraceae bacterium]|nr:DUF475 domain-containing protein [Candidatus Peribacteraceae bacterium]